jgi:hypothetical protein
MRSAMPRFLTVNGFSASPPDSRGSQDVNFDPEANAAAEFGVEPSDSGLGSGGNGVEQISDAVAITRYGVASTIGNKSGDQCPCLYFGPQGQRCDRPAIANGFCPRHTPEQLGQSLRLGVTLPAAGRKSRIAAIVLAALFIFENLWPIVSEVFREIIRLIHAH